MNIHDRDYEEERARLVLFIRSLRFPISAAEIMKQSGTKFGRETVSELRREIFNSLKEGNMQEGSGVEEVNAQKALERISTILGKSYAHLGDAEKIGTEEALQRIYREVKRYDPVIIARNQKRALPKQ